MTKRVFLVRAATIFLTSMRSHGIAAICALIAAQCPAAAQLDLSPYTARKPTHQAVFAPDEAKIAAAEIGIEGGILTATADDGTEYKLVVPPKALGHKTYLYLYPIKSATNLPPGIGQVRGAILKPDGVAFAEPALLHIKTREPFGGANAPVLAFNGNGRETRLTFSRRSGQETIVPVLHFSGAALPDDWKATTTKAFEQLGARDVGDSLIHGAEMEAQKAREAGRDPDKARLDYLQGHAIYSIFAGLLDAFAKAPTAADSRLRCRMSIAVFGAGIVSMLKASAAVGIIRKGEGVPGATAAHEAVAALPEEIDFVSPAEFKQVMEQCFDFFEAICLVGGNFRLLQSTYELLSVFSEIDSFFPARKIRDSYLSDTRGVAPAVVERARKILDQAVALQDVVSPAQYRDRVLRALGRCARYEVFHEADFKQTSYIGKGVYSTKTSIQAILSFHPGLTGDPIVTGKVSGQAPLRFGDCKHVYSRPSCAYYSSSAHRCEAHGLATVELTEMIPANAPQKTESLSLLIDPGRVDMHYRWCNQPCPYVPHTCIAADMPLLLTFPYSADNGPMRPVLPGSGHPVLADGQFRGHRVDPHGDDTFDDLSRVKVIHIGTGENALTGFVRDLNDIADICRTVPVICKILAGDEKKR